MKKLLHWLPRLRHPYQPLISVGISRSRILQNLAEYAALAPGGAVTSAGNVAPVLKSNAYGHGLLETAHILEDAGLDMPFLVVDSYYEAVALRRDGIRTPILVIGYTRTEIVIHPHLRDISFTVASVEALGAVVAAVSGRPISIQLKIDTGMHRQGILPDEVPRALQIILSCPGLRLEGIITHLSDTDALDRAFTDGQIAKWNDIVQVVRAAIPGLKYIHAALTGGAHLAERIDANVLRLGIGLYGLGGTEREEPVLEMRTILTGVKKIPAGATVGYNNTFVAARDMVIATIPVGYYEGLDRRLSSGPGGVPRGYVQVGHDLLPCPIIGRVSMNITIIDVSTVPESERIIGTRVIVISRTPGDPNSIRSIAAACGTIPYEIASGIPAHLRRQVEE